MLRVALVSTTLVLATVACKPAPQTEAAAVCEVKPQPDRPFLKPANDLEHKVIAFSCTPTLETEAALRAALLGSVVFVKVDPESLDPETALPTGGKADLWTATLPDGSTAVGVFTSVDAMASAFPPGTKNYYLGFQGDDALPFAKDGALVLNWGLDPHVILPPEAIAKLRDEVRGSKASDRTAPNLHNSGSRPAPLPR